MKENEELSAVKLLRKLKEELNVLNQRVPPACYVRRWEKPDYDVNNWLQCEHCGAWDDVSPCDACVNEGYVRFDENDNVVVIKPFIKEAE